MGVELDALEPADGAGRIATAEGEREARALSSSPPARGFRRLGVPGEDRLQGRGISTCASCDGPLLGGKTAAVVGGGDSALQEALTLAETADRVVILHRGEAARRSGELSPARRGAADDRGPLPRRRRGDRRRGDGSARCGCATSRTTRSRSSRSPRSFRSSACSPNSERVRGARRTGRRRCRAHGRRRCERRPRACSRRGRPQRRRRSCGGRRR